MPGGCIPWVHLQCIPGCIPGPLQGEPPGCVPSACLGPFLGASPGCTIGFICMATQEHRVLPPSNSETPLHPERLCFPFLEAFPWEIKTWELKKLHEEEGAGSGPYTVSLWYVETHPRALTRGPGSAFPEWQLLWRPGGNSPWGVLLLSLDTLDLQVLFFEPQTKTWQLSDKSAI